MSEWNYERHDDARWVAENGGDDLAPYLAAALDEIERMRALQEDPDAIERAVQAMMRADRDFTGRDTEWDETVRYADWDDEEIAGFERDARVALRAALNSEDGEQA